MFEYKEENKNMHRVLASKVSFNVDGFYYYNEVIFTGTTYTEYSDGTLRSEAQYYNGLRWGKSKEWYKNGKLAAQSEFFMDVMHGIAQEWSLFGQLTSEIICEYGIVLHQREWDEEGNLKEEYILDEKSSDFSRLQNLRKIYRSYSTKAKNK